MLRHRSLARWFRSIPLWCLLAGMSAWPAPTGAADLPRETGSRGPLFSVASSQDTLISYAGDYYGRHHLVLTFFPAAFTPV